MAFKIARLLTFLVAPAVTFSTLGANLSTVTYNFNDGMQGWSPLQSETFRWIVKDLAEIHESRSFKAFDPEDSGSLFMEVPQSESNRVHSHIDSPEIYIGTDGKLTFYVGFSKFYDDACRLKLQVSGDNFVTVEDLWNSKNEDFFGPNTWYWHPVAIDLSEYAGKDIKFRLLYTTGSTGNSQDRGGYSGDFAIDNFTVTSEVEDSTPPGGNGDDPDTRGESPTAAISLPADYVAMTTGRPFVPPYVPVTLIDNSIGVPDRWTWSITGLSGNPMFDTVLRGREITVTFPKEGVYPVALAVQNEYGVSVAETEIEAAFETEVANIDVQDIAKPFSIDHGVFPGSNTDGITAYGELFSSPPGGALIRSVSLELTGISLSDPVDRMASIGVHIYSARNGMPNLKLASTYMLASQLVNIPENQDSEISFFYFEEPALVEEEFFVVVDGLPTWKEGTCVSIGLAKNLSDNEGVVKKNGSWVKISDIIDVEERYSYAFYPQIAYSVVLIDENTPTEYKVGKKSGDIKINLSSYLPLRLMDSDCDWLSFESTDDDFTKSAVISYEELPSKIGMREGTVTFGDGLKSLTVMIVQESNTSAEMIASDDEEIAIVRLDGIEVFKGSPSEVTTLPKGVYLVIKDGSVSKIIF